MAKKTKKQQHKPHILWIIFVSLVWLGCIWYIYQTFVHAEINLQESISNVHFASQPSINQSYAKDNVKIVSNIAINKIAANLANSINKSKENYQINYDMDSDYSLQKYVSKTISFQDKEYIPIDLENIESEHIISRVINPQLRSPARKAFEEMAEAFYNQFETRLILVSAYRSYNDQKKLWDDWWCNVRQCAIPWTSEHQAWLAVDIQVEYRNNLHIKLHQNTRYYIWLKANAHKYGFHNTYQKWMHIDGQMAEWRHWRYLGKPLATYLNKKWMTIWEYYKKQKKVWNKSKNS